MQPLKKKEKKSASRLSLKTEGYSQFSMVIKYTHWKIHHTHTHTPQHKVPTPSPQVQHAYYVT